jgi:hypothetical protein
MDGLTEKIAAIVKEANQDGAFRQQLLDEPVAFLKAKGLDISDFSLLEISYTPGYGVFLGIDIRALSDAPSQPKEPRGKDINSDHFLDCLTLNSRNGIQNEQNKQSS